MNVVPNREAVFGQAPVGHAFYRREVRRDLVPVEDHIRYGIDDFETTLLAYSPFDSVQTDHRFEQSAMKFSAAASADHERLAIIYGVARELAKSLPGSVNQACMFNALGNLAKLHLEGAAKGDMFTANAGSRMVDPSPTGKLFAFHAKLFDKRVREFKHASERLDWIHVAASEMMRYGATSPSQYFFWSRLFRFAERGPVENDSLDMQTSEPVIAKELPYASSFDCNWNDEIFDRRRELLQKNPQRAYDTVERIGIVREAVSHVLEHVQTSSAERNWIKALGAMTSGRSSRYFIARPSEGSQQLHDIDAHNDEYFLAQTCVMRDTRGFVNSHELLQFIHLAASELQEKLIVSEAHHAFYSALAAFTEQRPSKISSLKTAST